MRGLRFRFWRWWHVRVRPSPLQREFNRGDPHGIVRDYADVIVAELEAEERLRNERRKGT